MKQRGNSRLLPVAFLLLTVMVGSGCSSLFVKKRKIPEDERLLPAMSMTRNEVMQQLESRSRDVTSLNAKVLLDAVGGSSKVGDVEKEYRQTTGYIVVDRPSQIRLKVQAFSLATVIDMVSNGTEYRASIPLKNQFYIGDAKAPPRSDNALLNLRPQDILNSLFIDIRPYLSNPQIRPVFEEDTVGRVRYYVVSFVDVSKAEGRLLEKIWVDRTNLQIVRKEIYDADGKLETDAEFSGYKPVGELTFPEVIQIRLASIDYSLKMTFQKTILNEKPAPEAFQLERPPGSELVPLKSGRNKE